MEFWNQSPPRRRRFRERCLPSLMKWNSHLLMRKLRPARCLGAREGPRRMRKVKVIVTGLRGKAWWDWLVGTRMTLKTWGMQGLKGSLSFRTPWKRTMLVVTLCWKKLLQ